MARIAELIGKAVEAVRGDSAVGEIAAEALTKLQTVPRILRPAIDATSEFSSVIEAKSIGETFVRMPNAFDYKTALEGRSVGPLPKEMTTAGTADGFAKVDGIASMLRSLDGVRTPGLKGGLAAKEIGLPDFTVNIGDTPVQVSKTNFGHVGHVYELSAGDDSYALKVFNDPARMDTHGAHAESGVLAYLSNKNVGDVVHLHGANPGPDGGWMMTEFLRNPRKTSGAKIENVLDSEGFRLGDVSGGFGKNGTLTGNRGPGSIVWDVGGVEPTSMSRIRPSNLREFSKLFNTSDGRMVAGRLVNGLRDEDDLKSALFMTLEHPESTGQVARSARYHLYDKQDLAEVLSKAIETPGGAGRAAAELDGLRGTPFFKSLYYKGLENPESRFETAKLIDHLAPEDRAAGFAAAFKYPEVRAMSARAIPSITDPVEHTKAVEMAMKDAGARYTVLMTQPTAVKMGIREREIALAASLAEHARTFGLDLTK